MEPKEEKGGVTVARPKTCISEYRNYELPVDFPVIALQGEEWRISPVRSSRLHFHNCLEIGLCRAGSGNMILEDQEVTFGTDTVTFVAPHALHTSWSSPDTFSLWSYLFLDVESILGQELIALPDIRSLHRMLSSGCLLLDGGSYPWAAHLVQAILEEMRDKAAGYQSCVRGLLLSLVARLLRVYMRRPAVPEKQTLSLSPALEYIHGHYMNNFPMEDLAEMCHLSPTHFRRLFHEQIGTTPLDFLHQVRVTASCGLLLTTGNSIAGVASQVGYNSLSCYNRHFLQNMGVTPSEWRKASRGASRHSVLTYTGWWKPETSEEILRKNK